MVDEESLSGCATSKLFTHALVSFYIFFLKVQKHFKSILNIYEYKSVQNIFFLQKYHFPLIQYLE